MSFHRVLRRGESEYHYIVRTVRRGDKVIQKVCEYLGRDPEPARLKRALEYWGVRTKVKIGKRAS